MNEAKTRTKRIDPTLKALKKSLLVAAFTGSL